MDSITAKGPKSVLLSTKIRPPKVRRQLLSRPRLLSLLGEIRDYQLVLLSAPTGYGKTTLLTDFARSQNMPLCWYTLDENDRDVAVFCRYLLHSIRQVYPTFGQSFEEMLGYNLEQLHQEAIVKRLVDEFVANLEELAEVGEDFHDTLLVLDDFQFAESFGVNQFVKRLVNYLPESYHLIISARKNPDDLPLIKLTGKQLAMGIDQTELAFTIEEINQLLKVFYNITGDDEDQRELAQTLASFAGGWITGVVLALGNRSLFRGGKWREVVVGNREGGGSNGDREFDTAAIFEYLAEEVLANQPAEIQSFLLKTSVFDLLRPSECDALLGFSGEVAKNIGSTTTNNDGSDEILARLESLNLFITHFAGGEREKEDYYQYHALFQEFLRSRLKQDKQLYLKTQAEAAQIQKARGKAVEAVRHYLEADAGELAASTLNEVAGQLYQTGRSELLSNLLGSIPVEEQETLPNLLSVKAQLLLEKGENEESLRIYKLAAKLYRKEGSADYAAKATANQAQLLLRTGRREEAKSLCKVVLTDYTLLMRTEVGQQAVALAKFMLANIAIEEGDGAEVEKNLREAAEIYASNDDKLHQALIDSAYGQLYQREGRLVKSTIYYERSLAHLVKLGSRLREAYCRVNLAINMCNQGHYRVADEQLNETLALSEVLSDSYLRLFVLAYLGNVYRDTERYSKADAIYSEALQLAQEERIRKIELNVLNDKATSYILQNEKEAAQGLIDLSFELAEDYSLPERVGWGYYNQGLLEFKNHSYKRALKAFEKSLSIFIESKAKTEEIRAKLLLANVLLAIGEQRKALVFLTESLEAAQELGYEPFLPFELEFSSALFKYASSKKTKEVIEEFLKRRGFITDLDAPTVQLLHEDNSPLPKPIPIRSALLQKPSTNLDSSTLSIFALDGGTVLVGEKEIKNWRTTKVRETLFYLVDSRESTRDQLFEALWPDEDWSASPYLLHTTLYQLRKALTPIEIELKAGLYRLKVDIKYDAFEFESVFRKILPTKNKKIDIEDVGQLVKALSLYKQDFLGQLYSNWCIERQQDLLAYYVLGLEKIARFYQSSGQFEIALPYWRQLTRKEPYNEEAHRETIECLLALGKKAEAKLQLAQCRKALEELNLQPSPETTILQRSLA